MALTVGLVALVIAPLMMMATRGGAGVAVLGMIVAIPVSLYLSLGLQVRRLRDMGWPPAVTILGWIGFMMTDRVIGHAVPAIALARGGTVAGLVINAALALALLLWPGRDGDDDDRFRAPPAPPERYVPTTRQRTVPGEPPTSPRPTGTAPRPAGFGRRLA